MHVLTDFTAILASWEVRQPHAVALTFGGSSLTWAELARRVRRNAAAQRAAGLQPGDRIAVLDLNHPSCLELTLACAQVGTANAVVNFRLAPPEIVYVINDARARLLFVGPEFAETVEKLREKMPALEQVIRIGGPDDEYEAWLAAHEPDADVYPATPDDCFVQLYTSGTTGFPKGAMLTHRGMLAHAHNSSVELNMSPEDRVQVAMPLFHVGGTSYALTAISKGARIVMLRLPDPAAVLESLEHERITHTFLVPALLGMMTKVPGAPDRDYSALKALAYGASPMPLPVMRASLELFPGVMQQVYGMTEQCGVVTVLAAADRTRTRRVALPSWCRRASRSTASKSGSATLAAASPFQPVSPERSGSVASNSWAVIGASRRPRRRRSRRTAGCAPATGVTWMPTAIST